MNPDNPYAAPQSTKLRVEDSPRSEARLGTTRRQFSDLSSAELQHLLKLSNALVAMSLVWMFAMYAAAGGLLWSLLRWNTTGLWQPFTPAWIGLLAIVGLRVWFDLVRRSWMRTWMMFADGLAAIAAGLLIPTVLFLYWRGELALGAMVVPIFFALYIGFLGWKSMQAAIHGPQLFSERRFQHDLISQELSYRQKNPIE